MMWPVARAVEMVPVASATLICADRTAMNPAVVVRLLPIAVDDPAAVPVATEETSDTAVAADVPLAAPTAAATSDAMPVAADDPEAVPVAVIAAGATPEAVDVPDAVPIEPWPDGTADAVDDP